MLAISPLMTSNGEEIGEGEALLDDINFDDLFVGFDDGDILPDLEIDSDDIFADFSFSSDEESGNTTLAVVDSLLGGDRVDPVPHEEAENSSREDKDLSQNEVISGRSKEDGSVVSAAASGDQNRSGRKTSASSTKGSHGKKKAKVDWTPELHRRFVQAVEQLGVDKAVPSRILELMGIDCLTRHNIASHLQKYRSHRKHLLAREAEAASWSQRRQMYSAAGGNNVMKLRAAAVDMKNPNWQTPPIIGFPPHQMQPAFRPLHVWGHPSMQLDRPQLVPVWPRHLSPPPPPPPWLPLRPPINGPPPSSSIPDPSYWHPHYQRALAQGTPCFPPQLVPTMRFQAPPVPGIPPPAHAHAHPLFRPPQSSAATTTVTVNSHSTSKHSNSQPQLLDAHPSNENIDAAIGDVLAKPWSPLPLGLKPPSLESVMVELQRQGVSNVPPTCTG